MGSPEAEVSLPLLPLFLPFLPIPLLEAVGDGCRRFSIGKETRFLGLFFLGFSGTGDRIRPPASTAAAAA